MTWLILALYDFILLVKYDKETGQRLHISEYENKRYCGAGEFGRMKESSELALADGIERNEKT